ncbi:GerMN domain-containing protein [Cohnella lupini]|uniref:Germination protein M n=1 Tax=Cohnella lupini TaxID=1294267 RepID=A0A3D9IQK2_9BACL|nr:GerMN domain-containing protein [Cohnella lupini]RED64070.1 germination protein M [Cohnella lupini]
MKTWFNRNKNLKRWAPLLLLLPALSACGIGPANDPVAESIDPPPTTQEEAWIQDTSQATIAEGEDVVTVYLLDPNGYLAPMTLRSNQEHTSPKSSAEKAIGWMTSSKELENQLPPGFKPVLPEGTKVASVTENEEEESISVDFVGPLPGIAASMERKVIESLVWTLTELPGVNKVKLSVGGKPIQSLPASGLPVDAVLTRGLGINLETADDVQINRSMGVTLYFSSQSADGEGYFVPVTRLITRQADPAKAALEQLILGPSNSPSLHAVLTSDMTIEKLTRMADTVNVALQDSDWMPETPVPSEMMDALVLTLTEAAGVPQVQVVMNGDDALIDSEQRSYERPVTRPAYVNTLSQ